MNVFSQLDAAARRHPDRPAITFGGVTLTYQQFRQRAVAFSLGLRRRGARPGDRVAILQNNHPDVLITLYACFHGGYVAVPVNRRSAPREVEQIDEDAQPFAWVSEPGFEDHLARVSASAVRIGTTGEPRIDELADTEEPASAHEVDPSDPAWLFFTSGTTGRMKGAVLTHRNLLAMVMAYLADVGDGSAGAGVIHAAPLTHGSGLYALPAVARGVTQHITTAPSYDPDEVLDLIERRGATDVAFLAPVMLNRLAEAQRGRRRDLHTLRNIVYGGAPMYVEDLDIARETFGPVLTQIYGQAEAPVTITCLHRHEHADPASRGSVGTAYSNVELRVLAADGSRQSSGTGEVIVRGDVVMTGYWEAPEATAVALPDGWLRTGDVGRLDEHGRLFLLDRNKDVIISGGANIYPREVEEVLLEHPDVREVAVVGAPDPDWGERAVAVVSATRDDHEQLTGELIELCRDRLSGYKVPRHFQWREELPKSAYGKVLKREIRADFWKETDRAI